MIEEHIKPRSCKNISDLYILLSSIKKKKKGFLKKDGGVSAVIAGCFNHLGVASSSVHVVSMCAGVVVNRAALGETKGKINLWKKCLCVCWV